MVPNARLGSPFEPLTHSDLWERYHTGFQKTDNKKRAKRQGALPFLK